MLNAPTQTPTTALDPLASPVQLTTIDGSTRVVISVSQGLNTPCVRLLVSTPWGLWGVFERCQTLGQAESMLLEWEDLVLSWAEITPELIEDCGLSHLPGVRLAA